MFVQYPVFVPDVAEDYYFDYPPRNQTLCDAGDLFYCHPNPACNVSICYNEETRTKWWGEVVGLIWLEDLLPAFRNLDVAGEDSFCFFCCLSVSVVSSLFFHLHISIVHISVTDI
jgi:hypothetical protein